MLKIVRQWIIDTLGFSKSEANGTLLLVLLILVIAILPKIYMHNTFSSSNGFIQEEPILEQWAEELEISLVKRTEPDEALVEKESITARSYPFDPNNVTADLLLELGFSERTANVLINFRESGGQFETKSDLMKIYGISEKRVNELWEYIELPVSYPEKKEEVITHNRERAPKNLKLEMNSVSEDELQKIRGVGPVLSARIVKFREALGGFYSLDQLGEVYGLAPETVELLKSSATISGAVRKVNINTDSASYLYTHPYIDYNMAYAIINYRTQHGNFDSISQIRGIKIVSDSLYQKIYPYLSLNQ